MKSTTSVYVTEEKVERLRQRNIPFSQVVETTMDMVLSDDFDDIDVAMRLRYNEDEITELKHDIAVLTSQIEQKRKRLNYLIDDSETLQKEWEESKYTVRLARLIRQLNKIIIASAYCEYDVKMSGVEVLSKICTINPQFDLTSHIMKFKKIMNR